MLWDFLGAIFNIESEEVVENTEKFNEENTERTEDAEGLEYTDVGIKK